MRPTLHLLGLMLLSGLALGGAVSGDGYFVPGMWQFCDWSECNAPCGGGEQTREVYCPNEQPDWGECASDYRPADKQACNVQPCTTPPPPTDPPACQPAKDQDVLNSIVDVYTGFALAGPAVQAGCGGPRVTCDNEGRVTELDLKSLDLTGPIPPELGLLTKLVKLYLGNNRLTGTLPPQLSLLINLDTLWIGHNDLTGTIPTDLRLIPNLHHVDLEWNNLAGPLDCGLLQSLREGWVLCPQDGYLGLCNGVYLIDPMCVPSPAD